MQTIVPHLWFDTQGVEAAKFYAATFPDSKILSQSQLSETPSGTVDLVQVVLAGMEFQFLSAGPLFKINPSVSFFVYARTTGEVDRLHAALAPGGLEMMALGSYPFSPRYAWVQDRFGVSWQLMYQPDASGPTIVPAQMFTGKNAGRASEALAFYTKLLHGKEELVARYGDGMAPNEPSMISHARFTMEGQTFALMDSAFDHAFAFNEAVSFMVFCETQQEIDRLWAALSASPEDENCGWLKDKFGFSWQIIPRELGSLMSGEAAPRVAASFLKMKKLDLAELRRVAGV